MGSLRTLLPAAVLGAAAVFALRGEWPWHRLAVAPPIVVSRAFTESVDTLHRGETLSDLFARNRVGTGAVTALAAARLVDPGRVRSGMIFSFRREVEDTVPSEVRFRAAPDRRVAVIRSGYSDWTANAEPIHWQAELVRLDGRIDASLYVALDEQVPDSILDPGERVRLAWDLADIYMWQVDFTRDIQRGDRFNVVLERLVSDEGEVRFGRILASELRTGGRDLPAFRFQTGAGDQGFYDASGSSLRRAFLRAPVQFRRISSSFSRSRFHPILNRYRAHAGTDYSADAGTPVLAAGNGIVRQAGWAGGYGNLVELSHANGITTRYGHLRGFAKGVRVGVRVTQGQVIGYVGSTGLATGAHLHYEFRVNGAPRDSRRIDLGSGEPVPAPDREAFTAEKDRLARLLYDPES